MEELKPCPFCGGEAEYYGECDMVHVRCKVCGATTPGWWDEPEDAAADWNRRISDITIDRPEIVCLCGPLRFMDAFRLMEYDLEMQGKIVVGPSFLPGVKEHDGTTGCTPKQKVMLDALHKIKIELSDSIFVINVDGYIGESTRSEIEHAEKMGKPVRYLEPL